MLKIKPQIILDAVNFFSYSNGVTVELCIDMEISEDGIRIGDSIMKFNEDGGLSEHYLDTPIDNDDEDDDDGYGVLDDDNDEE